jgi:hypothetical protein
VDFGDKMQKALDTSAGDDLTHEGWRWSPRLGDPACVDLGSHAASFRARDAGLERECLGSMAMERKK